MKLFKSAFVILLCAALLCAAGVAVFADPEPAGDPNVLPSPYHPAPDPPLPPPAPLDPECEHVWGEWQFLINPYYGVEGLRTHFCEKCSGEERETVDAPVFPLTDVKPGRWYTTAIYYCYDSGYMFGVSDTAFSLSAPVSRAMTVLIMAKIMNVALEEYAGETDFTDVAAGRWYAPAIEWAVKGGFAAGAGNGVFAPDRSVTRQELAVFIYKMAEASHVTGDPEGYADLSGYADYDELAAWARTQFAFAVTTGTMSGTTSRHLSPKITVTRAQLALFIYNYCDYVHSYEK